MTHCFLSHLSFKLLLLFFLLWIYLSFSSFCWSCDRLTSFLCRTFFVLVLLFLLIVMISKVTSQLLNNVFSSHSLDFPLFIIIIFDLFHDINMIFNPFIFFILSSIQLKLNKNSIFVFCFEQSFNILLQILSFDILPSVNIVLNCLKCIVDLVFRVLFIFAQLVHTEHITFFNCFVRFWFEYSPFFDRRLPVLVAFFLSLSLFNSYFFLPFFHLFKLFCSFQFDFFQVLHSCIKSFFRQT